MGNTDSIPIVSQVKSLVLYSTGDHAGALATQQNFAYNNTFPVISQIASAGYAIGGDYERAENLQKKFADDMVRIVDSIPVAGHIKGGIHYAMGDNDKGHESMKAASRSTGVVLGGVAGFAVGGPGGAIVGGVAGGAAADGIITGSEILVNGDEAKPYGYVAVGKEIESAIKNQKNISVSEGFDMALMPVSDGLGGYAGGKLIGKPLGLGTVKGKGVPTIPLGKGAYKPAAGMPKIIAAIPGDENMNLGPKSGFLELNKAVIDNRANQLNMNHVASGPAGRRSAYAGDLSKSALDNHANQLNPNNILHLQG